MPHGSWTENQISTLEWAVITVVINVPMDRDTGLLKGEAQFCQCLKRCPECHSVINRLHVY